MTALKPYDYKIYVTGPFQSGKTTLVHTLDPYAISVDRPLPTPYRGETGSTTTGFDLGRIMWVRESEGKDGFLIPKKDYVVENYEDYITKEIELRGVPGPLHFKFVRDTMRSNTDVVFLIIDSSDIDQREDAIAHFQEAHLSFHDRPIIVFANKQDREDAASPEEVAAWLGADAVFGLTTRDAEKCSATIVQAFRMVLT
ncbi:MAG: ADP-ribosylation factor-like protein [Candidatus Thorarchaeota archaeon]